MSKTITKNAIAIIIVVLASLALIYGAYLPLVKARSYITAINTLASVNSLEAFYAHFDRLLLYPSPVGQEEAVKYLGSDIANFVASEDQPEPVARALVSYLEPYLFHNNVRHLLMGGRFYEMMWARFGQQKSDFEKAEQYYLAARAIGPKLPPVLYSLYDLYGRSGELEKRAEVRETIIRYWPEEASRLE